MQIAKNAIAKNPLLNKIVIKRIRRGTPKLAAELVELERMLDDAKTPRPTVVSKASSNAKTKSKLLVFGAFNDGKLVGLRTVSYYGPKGRSHYTIVRPNFQNRGLGRILFEKGLDELEKRGVETVYAEGTTESGMLLIDKTVRKGEKFERVRDGCDRVRILTLKPKRNFFAKTFQTIRWWFD